MARVNTALTSIACMLVLFTAARVVHAQFGGSDPALAGPYFVRSNDGRTCIYYRIRNFAIRGYNTQPATARSPGECAKMCNDRPWCNSFEYSVDGRCFINANDIYVAETITAWNTAFDWDYWQLRDCMPASPGADAGGAGPAFAPPAQIPNGQSGPPVVGLLPDGAASDTLPSPLPVPAGGSQQNVGGGSANTGNTQVNLNNGEGRGSNRVRGTPVRDVSGFPAVSATNPPAADASGARVQNSK